MSSPQVHLGARDVEVAAKHNRFTPRLELAQIRRHRRIPRVHARVQSFEPVPRVGHVRAHDERAIELEGDDPSLALEPVDDERIGPVDVGVDRQNIATPLYPSLDVAQFHTLCGYFSSTRASISGTILACNFVSWSTTTSADSSSAIRSRISGSFSSNARTPFTFQDSTRSAGASASRWGRRGGGGGSETSQRMRGGRFGERDRDDREEGEDGELDKLDDEFDATAATSGAASVDVE